LEIILNNYVEKELEKINEPQKPENLKGEQK